MASNLQVKISQRAKKIIKKFKVDQDFNNLDNAVDEFLKRFGGKWDNQK